ncbi:MAG: Restriction endonuclease [Gemmatimonadetes bacterium]|nr:Restriction endonuclease [Gemmatimonadota bacterium]
MNVYVYPTDLKWFKYLAARPHLDEVNFWQPGGGHVFNRLVPGDLFLFRLKSPANMITGGGVFAHASTYPVDLAWQAFGEKNGTPTLEALRELIARYKRVPSLSLEGDARIGCIIIQEPFFLPESEWISLPDDYHLNLVQGKRFDASSASAQQLVASVSRALQRRPAAAVSEQRRVESLYGNPGLVKRRLGQGAFRVMVTDNYDRRCAVTGEKTLPVLQAAHIVPVSKGGAHRSDNGLLLRSDLHTLFDLGYVTVTPEHKFRVSAALRDEYSNGRIYYDMHDRAIRLPADASDKPALEFLDWHHTTLFRS